MKIIIKLLINALALLLMAWILPGIGIASIWTAIIAAIVLAIINVLIRPLVLFLTLPINILTLGLFTFVINALMLMLASAVVPGFVVAGFWWAILGSIILSIISTLLHTLLEKEESPMGKGNLQRGNA